MMNVATFLDCIDNVRGPRSDKDISQAAGLSGNAVAAMRAGKVPSLERAARVAEVVGLEVCLRRKGETVSPWALRLAIELLFRRINKIDGASPAVDAEVPERAEALAAYLIRAYGPFAELFDPSACDDPEEMFRVAHIFNRHFPDVEGRDLEKLTATLEDIAASAAEAAGTEEADGSGDTAGGT
ncbi:MAG: hypothetical protein J4F40_13090 [Alphaproteobacteria bacterium]|nr:hypothetical protein [Alphaproteobacteria bacterium]